MAYRWLVFVAGAVLLAVLAWYFGRPVVRVQHASSESVGVAAATPATEAPKAMPPKVMEVIDLARAYDPVREVESPTPGGINPASFIEEQYAPARIPYAVDEDKAFRELLIRIREIPFGTFLLGVVPTAETIDIKPREVIPFPDDLVNFVPTSQTNNGPRELIFTPMCVPFQTGIEQPIPPNASIQNGLLNFTPWNATSNDPVRLDVMPRVVFDETLGNALLYVAKSPFSNWGISPRIDISLAVPIEKLEVMPREVK